MTDQQLARIAVTDRIWHGAADYPRGLSGWQGRSTAALAVAAGIAHFTIPDKVKASWCGTKAEAHARKQGIIHASVGEAQARRARRG